MREGRFHTDRENDILSRALGNPEHPGRTQGTSGSVPWKYGFPESGGYRSRVRKKKEEADRLQNVEQKVAMLVEALNTQRCTSCPSSQQPKDAAHEAAPPSQRKSSVASTELFRLDIMAPRYPVDDITGGNIVKYMRNALT